MFSRFFIDRPIFAAVLSIFITLGGGIALFNLPLAQFPHIAPPVVQVDCNYPGANAQVVVETVAAPIEQQVNGVEGMLYMSSQCTNDGTYHLSVTFRHGMDLNVAQVLVQNRMNLALPLLPDVIKRTGVFARKKSPDILMMVNINSPGDHFSQLYLSNYALIRIRDELSRLPGIGDVVMSGERDYSMRVWLDPWKLAACNLTASDVVGALREQNSQIAAGQLGQMPIRAGQQQQYTLSILGRLSEVKQFENVVLKTTPDGAITRLKDVARLELGAKNEDISCHLDEKPSVGMSIYQLPDANALETAAGVHAKMKELERDFPVGVKFDILYDTTVYTRECIIEVGKTLRDSIILVALVVLVFLGSWRSALIPLVAVPVAIIGTFAVMLPLGFSLNTQTLFGLVLSIGIVVDDAIVVVEAVEHHIERGMAPREATLRAMEQVSGPVIAVGLVLSAVFVPCAFVGGVTGQFFRQFALTIAVSTILSAFNSLTLSPALAALLLRPRSENPAEAMPRAAFALLGGGLGYTELAPLLGTAWQRLHNTLPALAVWIMPLVAVLLGLIAGWLLGDALSRLLSRFFGLFNHIVHLGTRLYVRTVGILLRASVPVLMVYGGLVFLTYWEYRRTPTGFIPPQDRGFLQVNVQLPDAASLSRTEDVMKRVDRLILDTAGVEHALSVAGHSQILSAYCSNFGSVFVLLKDFDKRRSPDLTGESIAATLRRRLKKEIPDAVVAVFNPAPIRGVSSAGGFKLMIEDRGDLGARPLQDQTDNLVQKGNQDPELVGLYNAFRANIPQLYADVDRTACASRNVRLQDAFDTLSIELGSLYVNDFNRFGRTWQVVVQAEGRFRDRADHLRLMKVRNTKSEMVPLGTLVGMREMSGPLILSRYNSYPAASLTGAWAPGVSSGEAIHLMENLAHKELAPNMTVEWTELAYLEVQAGNTAMILFAFSVVMVFLVLAAQYESWSLPLAVILVVPMGILSALAGVAIAHMDINIFTRIGLVVLVGLASKNAVLIVQFAKEQREIGLSRRQATLEACKLRLRPILMTSFAFITGVLPLVVATGAGAEMRRPLGTTVFGGMLGVTLFGIFLTPVFFCVINRWSESRLLALPSVRWVYSLPFQAVSLCLPWRLWRLKRRPVLTTKPVTVRPQTDAVQTAIRESVGALPAASKP